MDVTPLGWERFTILHSMNLPWGRLHDGEVSKRLTVVFGGAEEGHLLEYSRPAQQEEVRSVMNIAKIASGLPVLILGALILADGVVSYVGGDPFWLGDTNPNLSIAVGLISVILGGFLIGEGRSQA